MNNMFVLFKFIHNFKVWKSVISNLAQNGAPTKFLDALQTIFGAYTLLVL